MKELFINENLTQQCKKLLWLTKQKQENLNTFGRITAKYVQKRMTNPLFTLFWPKVT